MSRDEARKNPNPVVIMPDVSILTSDQAADYVLCTDCEGRFNRNGENWTLRHCRRSRADFPLLRMLKEATPSTLSSPDFLIYEGSTSPGVDPDQLGYFAASVFWRGAIRGWELARRQSERLKLGKYEGELRVFLVGGIFPTDAVLIVTVSSESLAVPDTLTTFPFLKGHDGRFRQYKFTIPGITFHGLHRFEYSG